MKRPDIFRFIAISTINLWMVVWVLVPTLLILLYSFATRDPLDYIRWEFSLEGYQRLFDPLFFGVFLDTFFLAITTTLLCLLIGYPFAWWLAQLPPHWRMVALFMVIIPFWTNSLIRTYAVKLLLAKTGVINAILLAAGVIQQPLEMIYTPGAVIFGLVYILLPFMVLPLYSSIEKLDHSLLEAAHDLGASRVQVFTNVVFPLTLPGIIAGILIVLLPAMGMFYIADLLGGAKNLLAGNIIRDQFLSTADWPFGSALSVSMLVIMALLMFAYQRATVFVQQKGGIHDSPL